MILLIGYALSIWGIAYSTLAIRRVGITVVPILLISLITFNACLVSQNIIYSEFAKVWSNYGALYSGSENIRYMILIFFVYLVPFWILRRKLYYVSHDTTLYLKYLPNSYLFPASILLFCFSLIHITVLDLQAVMSSQEYLFLASSRALKIVNPGTLLVQSIYKYAGIICFLIFATAIISRKKLLVLTIAFPCVWFSLYELAGHSRFAAVYFGIAGGILLAYKRRVSGTVLMTIAVLAFLSALQGRNSELHGLSNLGSGLFQFKAFEVDQLMRFYANIFEGVFVQGEAFIYSSYEHDPIYKALSFSPFPSLIDNFNTRALPYALRLHRYVPMGASGEVYLFGPSYTVIYWVTISFAYFCILRLAIERRYMMFLLTMCFFILCSYLQFTYPVRWVYRFVILIILLFLLRHSLYLLIRR